MDRSIDTSTSRQKGHYLGTEIDEKWWKRCTKFGLFLRGLGEYWFDDNGFYFLRYLTKKPICIPFDNVLEIKTGRWHAGRWAWGRKILKIVWQERNLCLSSGFVVSKDKNETMRLKSVLGQMLERRKE